MVFGATGLLVNMFESYEKCHDDCQLSEGNDAYAGPQILYITAAGAPNPKAIWIPMRHAWQSKAHERIRRYVSIYMSMRNWGPRV